MIRYRVNGVLVRQFCLTIYLYDKNWFIHYFYYIKYSVLLIFLPLRKSIISHVSIIMKYIRVYSSFCGATRLFLYITNSLFTCKISWSTLKISFIYTVFPHIHMYYSLYIYCVFIIVFLLTIFLALVNNGKS